MKFKKLITILIFIISIDVFADNKRIMIASTTSTYDTGLLDELNKIFAKKYNVNVQVLSMGTGQAIKIAKDGNVEILLVHHKPSEIEFMKQKYGLIRYDLMYNDYILIGPKTDNQKCNSIESKLISVFNNQKNFISRGDDSGTHRKELELWKDINLHPINNKEWYLEVGQGMGHTLLIANEKKAYTLSDRSTWITFNKKNNLKIVCENFPPLFNQYGIILVNPKLNKKLNILDAKKYINWIISDEAKNIINNFTKENEQLFFYNHH